jgi:serine protease Do
MATLNAVPWRLPGGFTAPVLGLLCVLAGLGPASAQEEPPAAPVSSGVAVVAAMENVLVDAIARCEGSVVSIARVRREAADQPFAPDGGEDAFARAFGGVATPTPDDPNFIPNEFGAGVVIDADGLILTCYHVIREDCDHWVTLQDRKIYPAKIVAADPRSDLAVLRIDAKGLKPIPMGDGGAARKGQIVVALGNPYAIARDGQVSASWGIISNLGRKSPAIVSTESTGSLHQYGTLIQTDARLDLGASGGPLINLAGEMIGLTTSLAALSGHETHAGFAIPVDDVFRRAVDTMRPGKEVEYGLLGVIPENLTPSDRTEGLSGIVVAAVSEGTPAYKAGLQAADWITALDGEAIRDTDDFMLKLGEKKAGDKVRLTVNRTGRTFEAESALAKFFVKEWKVASEPPRAWRGMEVDYANAVQGNAVFEDFGGAMTAGCVVVTSVVEGSPAWEAGFRRGDFVARVEDVSLATPDEFFAAVETRPGPVTLHLPATQADAASRTVAP